MPVNTIGTIKKYLIDKTKEITQIIMLKIIMLVGIDDAWLFLKIRIFNSPYPKSNNPIIKLKP